jgi:hypothetical protein
MKLNQTKLLSKLSKQSSNFKSCASGVQQGCLQDKVNSQIRSVHCCQASPLRPLRLLYFSFNVGLPYQPMIHRCGGSLANFSLIWCHQRSLAWVCHGVRSYMRVHILRLQLFTWTWGYQISISVVLLALDDRWRLLGKSTYSCHS